MLPAHSCTLHFRLIQRDPFPDDSLPSYLVIRLAFKPIEHLWQYGVCLVYECDLILYSHQLLKGFLQR